MSYPRGEESMSLSLLIRASGGMENVGPIPKTRCTSGIGGIMPNGNTGGIVPTGNTGGIVPSGNINAFLGARTGCFYLLPTSFLALRDASLMTSLKAG